MATAAEPPIEIIYHLKIVLIGVAPTVWRRFVVPASMTSASLHRVIPIVMSREVRHLHQDHIAGDVATLEGALEALWPE